MKGVRPKDIGPVSKPKPKSDHHSDSRKERMVKRREFQDVLKRPAGRSLWPKVLWAQFPLVEMFLCF